MTQGLYAKHDLDLMHEIQPIQYNILIKNRTNYANKITAKISEWRQWAWCVVCLANWLVTG